MTAILMVFIIWIACMLISVAAEMVISSFKTNDYAVLRCLTVCGVLCVVTLLAMDLLTGVHKANFVVDSESRTYPITNVTLIELSHDVLYIQELDQVFTNCTINVTGSDDYLNIQRVYKIVPPSWISQNSYTVFLGHVLYLPRSSQGSVITNNGKIVPAIQATNAPTAPAVIPAVQTTTPAPAAPAAPAPQPAPAPGPTNR